MALDLNTGLGIFGMLIEAAKEIASAIGLSYDQAMAELEKRTATDGSPSDEASGRMDSHLPKPDTGGGPE